MGDDVLRPSDVGSVPAQPNGAESDLHAFLVADIRGYTAFTQRFGDERAAKLAARFAAAAREVVTGHGGSLLELRGDEALCTFRSPRQAVRAALALQQRFVDESRWDPELPLPVGIGIDIGEAVQVEGGYRGGALNLAARLCSMAGPGEVLATAEVTHLARRLEGASYVRRDPVRLKGIDEPVRPVRVMPEGEDPARQLAALGALPPRPPARPRGPSWLPDPVRRHPVLWGAAVVSVLVVVAAVVLVATPGGGEPALAGFSENVAGLLDPGSGRLVGQVHVGAGAAAVAAGAGSVWLADTADGTVSRVDPSSRRLVQTIDVGAGPSAVTVGGGSVWVANSSSGTVTRIDPATGRVRQTIQAGASPSALAFDAGALWVVDTAAAELLRIDPATTRTTARIGVGDNPSAVAALDGQVWVSNSGAGTVSHVDAVHGTVVQTVHVGNDPRGLAIVGDSVWVANNLDATVTRVSTSTASVVAKVPVRAGPVAVVAADGKIWVADQDGAAISKVDPARNAVVATVPTASEPAGLAPAADGVWVAAGVEPAAHHGGTFTALVPDFDVDPAYGYDAFSAPVQTMLYDGLVALRHAPGALGGTIVPDLATSVPAPSDGGRSYTFQLRRDVRWSTGAPVTGRDVRRGLERAVAAGVDQGYRRIVGADRCTATACDLSAGVVVDDSAGLVTIRLTEPDPDFLDKLAVPTAAAAPADTPLGDLGSRTVPTTGPYQVATYRRGTLIELVRNPRFREWSHVAQPAGFPDRFTFTVDPAWGEHPDAEVARTGFDWMDVRGARLDAVRARFGERLRSTARTNIRELFLNTTVAPFDDVRARQAVAYAVDRAAVSADWSGPNLITCQVLPPTVPGYRPYCPYTLRPDPSGVWHAPDLATAQRLVKESGTAGASVTVFTTTLLEAAMGHVVEAMDAIGYHARLRVLPPKAYFGYLDQNGAAAQAGFVGWIGDYPAAGDFFEGPLTCGRPLEGNYSSFCDRTVDRMVADALRTEQESRPAALDRWAVVDRRVVDLAPVVPLVVDTTADLLSARVGNYQRDALGPMFDQAWVR